MLRNTVLYLSLVACAVSGLQAQRLPTASKTFDLQAGGDFVYGESDYGRSLKGYGAYATLDFKPHFGAEIDFHQANGTDLIYERTYEIGARYVRHIGRLNPYAKGMVGRGVFNFPPFTPGGQSAANLAYNMFALGGGADYRVKHYLNVRGDFEYQFWQTGPGLANGLTPYLVSIGAAYHF